jgi:23S rRNA maturation mini-RNase III
MQYSFWRQRTYPDFQDESGDFEEDFEYDEEENTTLNSECKTLAEAKAQITAYDELIERVFDTNFKIVVTRGEDGKVEVSQDYYDCGY